MHKDPTTDTLGIKALIATLAGSATAFFGGMTAQEIAMLGGLGVGIVGLMVQIWSAYKADKERQERIQALRTESKQKADRHEYEMELLRRQLPDSVLARFEEESG